MSVIPLGKPALPHYLAPHVTATPSEMLDGQHLMVDWDATVTPHGSLYADAETVEWLGDQTIRGLSVVTSNFFLRHPRGLEAWEPHVYRPRFIPNSVTGKLKLITKVHTTFWYHAAQQEGLELEQITVIDNSFSLGAQAASHAGCRVILVDPLRNTERPEATRWIHKADRWQLGRVQDYLGRVTADDLATT